MKTLLFTLISLTMISAFADTGVGGPIIPPGNEGPYGGGGVVCGASQQPVESSDDGSVQQVKPSILTAQIWDLWESEAFKKLPTTHTNEDLAVQIQKALDTFLRINEMLPGEIKETVWWLYDQVEKKRLNPAPAGLEITPPTDVMSPFQPVSGSGCELKGIAAYDDTAQVLFIDYLLYDALIFKTDKAALFIHEAVYKYFRDHYGVKNSIAARNITACIFADVPCPELSPFFEVPEEGPVYKCRPEGWETSVVTLPNFNIEDNRMAEPEFLLFPIKLEDSPGMKLGGGFSPWRFQQIGFRKKRALSLDGFEFENVPARTFFDVQIDTTKGLNLRPNGTLLNYVLSAKGHLDMLVPTFSSHFDPWKRALGPRFTYRVMPSQTALVGEVSYPEMNGFPLTCEKVR